MKLGKINHLKANRFAPQGMYLSDEEGNEVLLPNSRLPEKPQLGDYLHAFIYRDSEQRLIATLDLPILEVDQFGTLEVKDRTNFGYFLDLGLDKQVLLPFKQAQHEYEPGDLAVGTLKVDEQTERLIFSTKLQYYWDREVKDLNEGDSHLIRVLEKNKLGYTVAVDHRWQGMIYHNEIFRPIAINQELKAHLTKVREDGKLDLSLQKEGMVQVGDDTARLKQLLQKHGFLALHDKSSPEEIKAQLQISKKLFKKAIGQLYKQRLISLEKEGIRWIGEED